MAVTIGSGDLLIAPPNMLDPRFRESVILVTNHTAEGSHGLCLNRSTEHTLKDILKPLKLDLDRDPEVYWGGPVSLTTVWMLHDKSWSIGNTQSINDQWSLTSHYKMFHHMVEGHWPDRFRIMLGHAGWGQGQLEAELRGWEPWDPHHSWLIAHDPEPQWLLDCDPEQMWSMSCSFCGQQTVDSWMS